MSRRISVTPSAKRLMNSLRDIGYSFESAVADLIDNSIAAGATRIEVKFEYDDQNSAILIRDNGHGMSDLEIDEAMRFGSVRNYDEGELGRYGLGLKTASLSQCKRIEVVSKKTELSSPVSRCLDLDFVMDTDKWTILDTIEEESSYKLQELLGKESGTVVRWTKLDRILPNASTSNGWSKRRFNMLKPKLNNYLALVFHRFISGEAGDKIEIIIDGDYVEAWDPFLRWHDATNELESDSFELAIGNSVGVSKLRRFVLPSRNEFITAEQFDSAGGINRWNRQQGVYVYRANRLVQAGGWAGIRAIDEHLKLGRAALDFDTNLDDAFNINVAKMRISFPAEIKKMLSRPLNELCMAADAKYRRANNASSRSSFEPSLGIGSEKGESIGLAFKSAAVRTGNIAAFKEISEIIKKEIPDLAKLLDL